MLFRRAVRQHKHLDWRSLEDWLSDPNLCCRVLHKNGAIHALAGATVHQPLNAPGACIAWLRFLVPPSILGSDRALDELWQALRDDLRARSVRQVALLFIEPWVGALAARWGFVEATAVITLRRVRGEVPPDPASPYAIREVSAADLDVVERIDAASFEPLWQYSKATLEVAASQSATFTLLEQDGQPIGYQLSTRHDGTGHLARLAVLPELQGRGLGALLVGGMLRFFQQRSISLITVNTQADNLRSQRLYHRLGFEVLGPSAPVWTLDL